MGEIGRTRLLERRHPRHPGIRIAFDLAAELRGEIAQADAGHYRATRTAIGELRTTAAALLPTK